MYTAAESAARPPSGSLLLAFGQKACYALFVLKMRRGINFLQIISERKMSWQQYVDDQLLATKQVEKSHPLKLVSISVITHPQHL